MGDVLTCPLPSGARLTDPLLIPLTLVLTPPSSSSYTSSLLSYSRCLFKVLVVSYTGHLADVGHILCWLKDPQRETAPHCLMQNLLLHLILRGSRPGFSQSG